jgi:formylglycine-generating enzyme required for sulfatase activity
MTQLKQQQSKPMKRTSMKTVFSTSVRSLFVFSTVLCAALQSTLADEARFFRIVGPTATTITAVSPDGYITWSNAQVGSTYTAQTARSLGAASWVDYIQVPARNNVVTQRLYDPNPLTGMAFIPAGSFTMGNTFPSDTLSNQVEQLHTVFVSALYMDKCEVTKALWDEVYQWATNHGYNFYSWANAQGKTNSHPIENVTWYGVVKWCNARSEMEGRIPAYYTRACPKSQEFGLVSSCTY